MGRGRGRGGGGRGNAYLKRGTGRTFSRMKRLMGLGVLKKGVGEFVYI